MSQPRDTRSSTVQPPRPWDTNTKPSTVQCPSPGTLILSKFWFVHQRESIAVTYPGVLAWAFWSHRESDSAYQWLMWCHCTSCSRLFTHVMAPSARKECHLERWNFTRTAWPWPDSSPDQKAYAVSIQIPFHINYNTSAHILTLLRIGGVLDLTGPLTYVFSLRFPPCQSHMQVPKGAGVSRG